MPLSLDACWLLNGQGPEGRGGERRGGEEDMIGRKRHAERERETNLQHSVTVVVVVVVVGLAGWWW